MAEDKNVKKKGFIKGMKSELKKVIWPTGEQTVKSTFATIAFVILVSLVLIVFNLLFNTLSNLWIKSLSKEDIINNILSSGETNEVISGEEETIIPEITAAEEESEGNVEQPESIQDEISSEETNEPIAEISSEEINEPIVENADE